VRVLLVENEASPARSIAAQLATAGVRCDHAVTACDAEHLIATTTYSLVLLELGLPDESGISLVRRLRRDGKILPVIGFTDAADAATRIEGLRAGADDLLSRPFAFDELQARMEAVLRRQGVACTAVLRCGSLSLDAATREVWIDDRPVEFSARELEVLELLLRRAGRVVPKQLLEDQLFGADGDLGSNAIEVYIHRLRRKLSESGALLRVVTVRDVGYKLVSC